MTKHVANLAQLATITICAGAYDKQAATLCYHISFPITIQTTKVFS